MKKLMTALSIMLAFVGCQKNSDHHDEGPKPIDDKVLMGPWQAQNYVHPDTKAKRSLSEFSSEDGPMGYQMTFKKDKQFEFVETTGGKAKYPFTGTYRQEGSKVVSEKLDAKFFEEMEISMTGENSFILVMKFKGNTSSGLEFVRIPEAQALKPQGSSLSAYELPTTFSYRRGSQSISVMYSQNGTFRSLMRYVDSTSNSRNTKTLLCKKNAQGNLEVSYQTKSSDKKSQKTPVDDVTITLETKNLMFIQDANITSRYLLRLEKDLEWGKFSAEGPDKSGDVSHNVDLTFTDDKDQCSIAGIIEDHDLELKMVCLQDGTGRDYVNLQVNCRYSAQ